MCQDERRAVLDTLDRFGSLVAARDPSLLALFAQDADTRLAGSESSELACGPAEIRQRLGAVFALPGEVAFDWRNRQATLTGDIAWIFADGELVLRDVSREQRGPYRLTVVLERRDGAWLWRHFHGSEPRPDR